MNEDYAISGISSVDINLDGRLDLVSTNGVGFGSNSILGPRLWHGI